MSIHSLLFAAVGVVLAGCASPRYHTDFDYQPPSDAAGLACVQVCGQARTRCGADCQAAWQICAARVEPRLETEYAQALDAYAADLGRYQHQLQRLEWDLWSGWGASRFGGFGYSSWQSGWPYPFWPGLAFSPAPPLAQPTRDSVRQRLHRSECQDDCGCQAQYDTCFLGCGGVKSPRTRCVANCPDETLR
jgi:hypothetical protein